MNEPDPTSEFRANRRRTLAAIAALPLGAIAAGVLASVLVPIRYAILVSAAAFLLGLYPLGAFVRRTYLCSRCHRMPLRVSVGKWTTFTWDLRKAQALALPAAYPPAAILFIDLNARICGRCHASLRT